MSPVRGAGRICPWDGGSLWIGRAVAPNDVHAHHAIQVGLALEGHFRFQSPVDGVWHDCTGAVVASNHPHAFDGREAPLLAHVFVEPESPAGRALARRFPGVHGIALLPAAVLEEPIAALAACHRRDPTAADLVAAARGVIGAMTEGVDLPTPVDSRVLRALEYLRAHLDEPLSLERIAGVVHLSPSRFRHLFVRETGLAFRPYLLWLRLNRALEAFAGGESLTTAAYRAGFADSAHLSRTFRRMYGLPAATLRLD